MNTIKKLAFAAAAAIIATNAVAFQEEWKKWEQEDLVEKYPVLPWEEYGEEEEFLAGVEAGFKLQELPGGVQGVFMIANKDWRFGSRMHITDVRFDEGRCDLPRNNPPANLSKMKKQDIKMLLVMQGWHGEEAAYMANEPYVPEDNHQGRKYIEYDEIIEYRSKINCIPSTVDVYIQVSRTHSKVHRWNLK